MDSRFLYYLNESNTNKYNLNELMNKYNKYMNKRSVLHIKMAKFIKNNKSDILLLFENFNKDKYKVKKLIIKGNVLKDFNKIKYVFNKNYKMIDNEIYIEYNKIKNEYDELIENMNFIKKYIINKYEDDIIYGLLSLYNQNKNISYNSKKRKINK